MVYKLINFLASLIHYKKIHQGEIYNPFQAKYEEGILIGKFYVTNNQIIKQYKMLTNVIHQDTRN